MSMGSIADDWERSTKKEERYSQNKGKVYREARLRVTHNPVCWINKHFRQEDKR